MSNQLENKRRSLAQILANNRLTKVAADQEIEHMEPTDQSSLGAEQTDEIKNLEGVNAATAAAANKTSDRVDELPNCQSLNRDAASALASSGTSIDVMDQEGDPAAMPKSASYYRGALAGIVHEMNKRAAAEDNFKTGTEVLHKLASLDESSTEDDIADAQDSLLKLASTNPLFSVCRDRILMTKMAEDVEALAEAEGISPEDAADVMDAAAAENPEILQDAEDEATGEAVADLADAEQGAVALEDGVNELAANASEALGAEVTPDDIMTAVDEVEAQADELGVPPEALIQAAMEDIVSAEGAGEEPEITEEDQAAADAILQEAAANGISPEEVIQMAAEELGGNGGEDGEGCEECEEGEECEDEEDDEEVKEAACKKRGGCGCKGKRMAKCASFQPSLASTPRAQYVQKLVRQ